VFSLREHAQGQGTVGGMNEESESPDALNLAERIRRLANGRTTIDVAQFQFIGLNEIRDRYGPRWTDKRDRVQRVARHFIAKRIAPEDVLIPGADGFLVVFGSRSGVLADTAADRITQELNTFFLGAADVDADIRFEAWHKAMSIDDFAATFGELIVEEHSPVTRGSALPQDPALIGFGFTPVWDVKRAALTTYFVTPVDPSTGGSLDAAVETTARHAELDELKLKISEESIRSLFKSDRRALVGVALHVSSLNNEASVAKLYSVISKFDKMLLQYRVVRVTGVEPGFPRIYLDDITRTLKTRVPKVAIGLNWMEPDIASVLRLQPAAIGFTLPPGALSVHAPRAELFARVHAAIDLAKPHGIPVYIEGDITPDQAQRFALDGVQLLASPRIWPARPALPAAEKWHSSRLSEAVRCESAA
jgi:hypothetical protein